MSFNVVAAVTIHIDCGAQEKSSGEGEWLPTPVFLPGEFWGQRGLMGHSPWGCKESDTTEQLTFHYSCVVGLVLYFVYEEYLQGRHRALKGTFYTFFFSFFFFFFNL